MTGQEDEDLKMTSRQSMPKHESPEPKRSKPWENTAVGMEVSHSEEPVEVRDRCTQRELMAAAAERRMAAAKSASPAASKSVESPKDVKIAGKWAVGIQTAQDTPLKNTASVENMEIRGLAGHSKGKGVNSENVEGGRGISGTSLSIPEADELFLMIFGNRVSKDILAQWSNQGIRFSADPETSMGLVQHEGGPCGVLAAIQALLFKYLIFCSEPFDDHDRNMTSNLSIHDSVALDILSHLSEGKKSRALVSSMCEILFLCGRNERAKIASLDVINHDILKNTNRSDNEAIAEVLRGVSVECGADLQKVLRVDTCTSRWSALRLIETLLPIFQSRLGALLFLISALLSRGLENVQDDRDDPSQPLVTAPFGHASQEIVNLLISGSAVANVFDDRMDLGGDMFVKGITTPVEVGFLTLLESLNFCKVGNYLKRPQWPIWVVGSESHYTVLFALDNKVQDENELDVREALVRRAFDSHDQSGGGGFVSASSFLQILRDAEITLPAERVERLCSAGFVVWSEFWELLLDLDWGLGGVRDPTGMRGKKVFDLYHFNGIAKSTAGGPHQGSGGSEVPVQRPRMVRVRVWVPPRWTPEEFMSDAAVGPSSAGGAQHAPLVDCVRTRWARAVCTWEGDAPSIV